VEACVLECVRLLKWRKMTRKESVSWKKDFGYQWLILLMEPLLANGDITMSKTHQKLGSGQAPLVPVTFWEHLLFDRQDPDLASWDHLYIEWKCMCFLSLEHVVTYKLPFAVGRLVLVLYYMNWGSKLVLVDASVRTIGAYKYLYAASVFKNYSFIASSEDSQFRKHFRDPDPNGSLKYR